MKQITKQEARNKYGVIVTGANSFCNYYLTDDGYIIDDCGDIRYIPPTDPRNILQRNFEGGTTNAEHQHARRIAKMDRRTAERQH